MNNCRMDSRFVPFRFKSLCVITFWHNIWRHSNGGHYTSKFLCHVTIDKNKKEVTV